jgi:hypothetical protein
VVLVIALVVVIVVIKPFDNFAGGASDSPATTTYDDPAAATDDPEPATKDPEKVTNKDFVGTWTLGGYVGKETGATGEAFDALTVWLSDSASQESIDNLKASIEKLPGVEQVVYYGEIYRYLEVFIVDYEILYGLEDLILELPALADAVDYPEDPEVSISTKPTPVMKLTDDGKAYFEVDSYWDEPDDVADYEIDGETFVLRCMGYEARLGYRFEDGALIFLYYDDDLGLDFDDMDALGAFLIFEEIESMYRMQDSGLASLHRS